MSKKSKILIAFVLIASAVILIGAQVLAQDEPPPTTRAEAIVRAEKDQQAAQSVVTELTNALAAARAAGDTQAVQTLAAAVRLAEVRFSQVVQQVEQVRRAPTLAAAVAQLRNADRALARVTEIIPTLPPAVVRQYVTTIATTTVAPTTTALTTTETTGETTAATTAGTTTETTAGTTIAPTTVATTIPATTSTVFTTSTYLTTSTVRSK